MLRHNIRIRNWNMCLAAFAKIHHAISTVWKKFELGTWMQPRWHPCRYQSTQNINIFYTWMALLVAIGSWNCFSWARWSWNRRQNDLKREQDLYNWIWGNMLWIWIEEQRRPYFIIFYLSLSSYILFSCFVAWNPGFVEDSIFEEFFYKDLVPFVPSPESTESPESPESPAVHGRSAQVHFVPIARDRCSTDNLTSTLEYLRSHDQEAQTIAKDGVKRC